MTLFNWPCHYRLGQVIMWNLGTFVNCFMIFMGYMSFLIPNQQY